MVPKEINEYLHGKYGQAPAEIDQDIKKKIIGDDEVITCRPADLLAPEFESLKEKYKDLAKSDEDVLSLALFEKVAVDYMEKRNKPKEEVEVEEFNLIIE